jgi:hypothetical protein
MILDGVLASFVRSNQTSLWVPRYSRPALSSRKAACPAWRFVSCPDGNESLVQLHRRTYQVGANVRITRGSLAGVTGVVIETRNQKHNGVLSIDFWANGVLLSLNGDDLEQIEMNRPRL